MYYFLRITPANVLYALWLTLRGPVAAWKIEVPAWPAPMTTVEMRTGTTDRSLLVRRA